PTKDRAQVLLQLVEVRSKIAAARASVAEKEAAVKDLTLYAPRDGVVGQGPATDDLGKQFQASKDQQQPTPLFTIVEPGKVRICLPVVTPEFNQLREGLEHKSQERRRARQSETGALEATVRVHGLDSTTWTGKVAHLEEQEARFIPLALSNKAGGPVAVA